MSDEKAELVKILNNGNARGFPVLRSEQSGSTKEFNPVAYQVFGPKIVATRGFFQDRALESRFITEDTGVGKLRSDIPINLPSDYEKEALALQNKLLMFRFRNARAPRSLADQVTGGIEPRLKQIFSPLLSMISNSETREAVCSLAISYNKEITVDRESDIEAQVLQVIRDLISADAGARLAIGDVTARFIERFGQEYERKITEKWIGGVVRRKLKLKTQKTHGVFGISRSEDLRLKQLFERYGLARDTVRQTDKVDFGDIGSEG
jgi:hypothetical protein